MDCRAIHSDDTSFVNCRESLDEHPAPDFESIGQLSLIHLQTNEDRAADENVHRNRAHRFSPHEWDDDLQNRSKVTIFGSNSFEPDADNDELLDECGGVGDRAAHIEIGRKKTELKR